jgi:hypothetical protein
MSAIDPGILALALGDLQEELVHWGGAASEAIHSAEDAQRKSNEAVERMLHRARLAEDQAQRDSEASRDARERQATLMHQCEDGMTTAGAVQRTAGRLHSLAQTTVRCWLQELSAARAWLVRAERRLELALKELAAAESELRSAQWDLSSAESNLRA